MSDVPFHLTRMGQRSFDATLPRLVKELERLNENLERVVAERQSGDERRVHREQPPLPDRPARSSRG